MPGLPRCTRSEIREKSLHPANGFAGLRLINNTVCADGSGRDWCMFGDPSYHGGRRTPQGADQRLPPKGDRPSGLGINKRATSDGRRGVGVPVVPRHQDGSAKKPLPGIVARWQRVNSSPCILDAVARCAARPGEGKDVLPMAHYLTADEQAKLDAQFKPNMATHRFSTPTFPVDKHHYFGQQEVKEAKRPDGAGVKIKLGPPQTTYTAGLCDSGLTLENSIYSKHHYFSEPTIQQSCHFQTTSPHDGLAKPRKQFHGPVGSLTASLS